MVMQDLEWSDDLSVGIADIDKDHKKLLILLNQLFAAGLAGVGEEVLDNTLKELEEYTHYHFNREEELLARYEYPSLEPHKFQHQKLIKQLQEYSELARTQADSGLSADVMSFLRGWLINHIKEHDHQYASYLHEKGAT